MQRDISEIGFKLIEACRNKIHDRKESGKKIPTIVEMDFMFIPIGFLAAVISKDTTSVVKIFQQLEYIYLRLFGTYYWFDNNEL